MDNNTYHDSKYRLLVFSKSPSLGKVKTRMQPVLTEEESLKLHIELSRYCLQEWSQPMICPMDIWVAGSISDYQKALVNDSSYTFYSQVGNDLGERMEYAVATTLQSAQLSGVILVGTDCPFISNDHLKRVVEMMGQGNDAVIIPANDGGYVLLGLKLFYSELFSGIEWGGEKVYADTIKKMQKLNITYHEMDSLPDIDRPEDLPLLEPLGFGRGKS